MPIPQMKSFQFEDHDGLKARYTDLINLQDDSMCLADDTLIVAAAVSLSLNVQPVKLSLFVRKLQLIQKGMPGGILRSRQIISLVGTEFL